jgi:hypothetical protein
MVTYALLMVLAVTGPAGGREIAVATVHGFTTREACETEGRRLALGSINTTLRCIEIR